jgi:hypothetical protein
MPRAQPRHVAKADTRRSAHTQERRFLDVPRRTRGSASLPGHSHIRVTWQNADTPIRLPCWDENENDDKDEDDLIDRDTGVPDHPKRKTQDSKLKTFPTPTRSSLDGQAFHG